MFKSIILNSALALSSLFSFNGAFAREAVIKSVSVESANGGINPDFAGIRIHAVVETLDAGCEATRSRAKLKLIERDGQKLIVADVKPFFIARHVPCAKVPADFKGLKADQYFNLPSADLAVTLLANIKEEGNNVSIEDLLAQREDKPSLSECADANKTVFCTMEWNPTTCTYGDRSVQGSNPCGAFAELIRNVCLTEKNFVGSDVVCASGDLL